MGCSGMKSKSQNHQQQSFCLVVSQFVPEKCDSVICEQSDKLIKGECFNITNSKPLEKKDIRLHQRLLSQLIDKQNKKMEKNKYNSQYIKELMGDNSDCYYIKKADTLAQSAENYSTFCTPLKKQGENKSQKNIRKTPVDNLINIF